ncbi:hypothetical protein VTO42DRAFT_8160 [Malbranchea cinnamomea]
MPQIFSPLQVGNCHLAHRIAMCPLTRWRANAAHVHQSIGREYYEQRASVRGTLLISEATFISPRAAGYANAPGIWNDEQIQAWKEIVDAVHAKGSYIYLQLWALGRAANAAVLKQEFGHDVVSSSAVPLKEGQEPPRALTEPEIHQFIADYAQAAKNAVQKAGFDGVEIHAANGYLIDQFTQDTCNKRTDNWGGSVENRARFCLEVTRAVVDAVGAQNVGLRLSPYSTFQGMRMADPVPQFTYLVERLRDFKLAYLHVVEPRIAGNADIESSDNIDWLVNLWGNTSPVVVAGGYKPDLASVQAVADRFKESDVIVGFGRYYISNPDLPFRIQKGIAATPYDRGTFYIPESPKGYIDYPFSEEFLAARL